MASSGDRPYDPYIPAEGGAGGPGAGAQGNQRTAALQAVSCQLSSSFLFAIPATPGYDRMCWGIDCDRSRVAFVISNKHQQKQIAMSCSNLDHHQFTERYSQLRCASTRVLCNLMISSNHRYDGTDNLDPIARAEYEAVNNASVANIKQSGMVSEMPSYTVPHTPDQMF